MAPFARESGNTKGSNEIIEFQIKDGAPPEQGEMIGRAGIPCLKFARRPWKTVFPNAGPCPAISIYRRICRMSMRRGTGKVKRYCVSSRDDGTLADLLPEYHLQGTKNSSSAKEGYEEGATDN